MAQFNKILIIKTSSLGDVIHLLPAISDALERYPHLQIDWMVEEAFAEIPRLHPAIRHVYPVAVRRWRKQLLSASNQREIALLKNQLAKHEYDAVIDAQGLLKSAWISRWAKGVRYGFDYDSAREAWASFFYQHPIAVTRDRHAIKRNRLLLANVLGYSINPNSVNYGIRLPSQIFLPPLPAAYVLALHGTSRPDKEWLMPCWQQLAQALAKRQLDLLMPWGNERELLRAQQLAAQFPNVQVLPKSNLSELALIIDRALGVIGMDTGLMHLAAALGKSGIALYPTTEPALTGVISSGVAQGELEVISGTATQDCQAVIARLVDILHL